MFSVGCCLLAALASVERATTWLSVTTRNWIQKTSKKLFPAESDFSESNFSIPANSLMQQPSELLQFITTIDPSAIIPALEKGIEIEKLELAARPGDKQIQEIIISSRALLSLLYCIKLGLK